MAELEPGEVVSMERRGIVISLAELTVSKDWRPPKEFLSSIGEPFVPNPWEYSDDSVHGHLLAASQMHEHSMGTAAHSDRRLC